MELTLLLLEENEQYKYGFHISTLFQIASTLYKNNKWFLTLLINSNVINTEKNTIVDRH